MDKYKANPEISPEIILGYISQKEIMEKYLEVEVDTKRGSFCSPLRGDKNPTCTFTWINGKLLFRDWAKPRPFDCFGVVMEKFNVGYHEAQKIVAKDFGIIRNIELGKPPKREVTVDFRAKSSRQKCSIEVKIQSFTPNNVSYLSSYHITEQICNRYNVYCPKYVWINGRIHYIQDNDNPALAYYFGLDENKNQKWKIYFYKNQRTRFLTNTNRINGWVQLPDSSKNLIITKSLKDVMCLDLFNIPAVAMQAETQTPYDYIIEELRDRFDNIISLFDHDDAGITRAKVLQEKYNIPYFFIKDKQAKDFSDYIKVYGKQEGEKLTKQILCS